MASRKPKHPAKRRSAAPRPPTARPAAPARPFARRPVPRLNRGQQLLLDDGLDLAEAAIDEQDWDAAATLLETLNDQMPHQPVVLLLLVQVYTQLQDPVSLLETCEELLEFAPEPETHLALAAAYGATARFVHLTRTLRTFLDTWPDHPEAALARETLEGTEPLLQVMLDDYGLTGPDGEELALQHERIQILVDQGRLPEARRAAEQFLKRRPDFSPVLNNLSQVYALEGQTEQAIATAARVLARQPDNVHTLGNLVHYLCQAGRDEEARVYAEDLKAVPTDLPDLLLKKMEALSYLGDDPGVLDVFTQFQKERDLPPDMEAFALHLAAAAAARQGDEGAARRYWKKALKLAPGLPVAEENLANLDAPAEERAGAWAFPIASWVPSSIVQDLVRQVGIDTDLNEAAYERAMRRFLRKHPGVVPLIPTLLDRGDPMSLVFALNVARFAEDERVLASVRAFALGKRGPLTQRHMAARIARRAGLLPGGSLRMWTGKDWTDMLLLDFEIHGEHEQRHSRAVERLLERGSEALHSGDGATAEQLFRQALVQEPEAVDVRNNLAAALTAQGRTREADEMILDLFAEHPDYFFARTNRAHLYVREGKLDAATDLLAPLLQRNRLHFSELTALCQVEIELLLAQGKTDGARIWFELWEGAVPESPNLELWRGRVHPRLRLPWKHAG